MVQYTRPKTSPPVLTEVVQRGFCSGCGVCVALCPHHCLEMTWDEYGMRVPRESVECPVQCGLCIAVCPFGSHNITEDDLAEERFGSMSGNTKNDVLGYCLGAYVGHVAAGTYRADGTSGGVAKWFLTSLLERQHVDRVLCVMPGPDPDNLFQFAELDSADAVRTASKSAYYPTDIAGVLQRTVSDDRRIAVIALPCVAKALRLAARRIPRLADKVVVVAGLVCGQLKSRGFAEYLVRYAGFAPAELRYVSFRQKAPDRPASNFDFIAADEAHTGSLPWLSTYQTAWATGQFKLGACDVCDDVFAETADIVFMDAWLPEYRSDPQGTSVVVTRSQEAENIVREGITSGELHLQPIPVEDVLRSQSGVIQQKRQKLAQRLWMMDSAGEVPPAKRVQPVKPGWYSRLQLVAAEQGRMASHKAMKCQRGSSPVGLDEYDALMRRPMRRLMTLRTISRFARLPGAVLRRGASLLQSLSGGTR